MEPEQTLASRLGVATHVSPLRRRVRKLMEEYPGFGCSVAEDWLLDVANHRGVRSVSRAIRQPNSGLSFPDRELFSNADLLVAICQPQNRDRPQWLRAAAELISKGEFNLQELILKAKQERVERVLAELSRQALKAEPGHASWLEINGAFGDEKPFLDSLIHWTRLTTKKADPKNRTGKLGHRPLAR